jgi:hypothetical protein
MAHGNSIADRNSVKFKRSSARAANGCLDHLRNLVEVNVARHYLAEAVGNTDKRLVDVGIAETAGVKQAAMRRPLKILLDCVAFHNLVSPKLPGKAIQKPENVILTADKSRIKKNQLF